MPACKRFLFIHTRQEFILVGRQQVNGLKARKTELLEELGYKTVTASCGDDALEPFGFAEKFDLGGPADHPDAPHGWL